MRKKDMTPLGKAAETAILVLGIIYIGLQIYYGVAYQVRIYTMVLNIAMEIAIYAGLSLLSLYPEKVQFMSEEQCTGSVRRDLVRMLRTVKFIFVLGLLVPCIADALGFQMKEAYCLLVVGAIFLTIGAFEYRIIQTIRKNQKKH